MDILAPSHLLILLLIILVIFGPSKLGDVGGALGRAIRDFKKAMNEPEQPSSSTAATRSVTAPAQSAVTSAEGASIEAKADKTA
jgi:sec-independent protein translocase protein TatA